MAWGTELEKWKPYERSQQILWSLINDIFHFMIAHSDFVITHKDYLYQFDRSYRIFMTAHMKFFWSIFYILGVEFWYKTAAEEPPIMAWGTELEKWKPYERSQQILWSLINDIFHFMIAHSDLVIAHKDYVYRFDRSYRIFMTAHMKFFWSIVYILGVEFWYKNSSRGNSHYGLRNRIVKVKTLWAVTTNIMIAHKRYFSFYDRS